MNITQNFIYHYEELLQDIYPQPVDTQHTQWATWIIRRFHKMFPQCKTVLDVGCGEGFCQDIFGRCGFQLYIGVCLGIDYLEGRKLNNNIFEQDYNFLSYEDNTFDLVFARHVLEHSPMPLLSLMEWHRVSKRWLLLVMPNPDYWNFFGRNHYFVMNKQQIRWMLRRAGWKVVWKQYTKYEYRYFCEKHPRISYEGYVPTPLPDEIHDEEKYNP